MIFKKITIIRYFYAQAHNLKYFGQVIVLMVYRYMQRFPIFLLGQKDFVSCIAEKQGKDFAEEVVNCVSTFFHRSQGNVP